MKYLYRILRLFFCPHKYEVFAAYECIYERRGKVMAYHSKCKYCGNIKITES